MTLRHISLFAFLLLLGGCSTFGWKVGAMNKIQFDYFALNADGLKGSEGDLRSISYEFCFPGNIEYVDEVMAIDKTLVVYRQSPGRIQCGDNEYLGMGNTEQPDYRDVLRKLAELEYVNSIHEVVFE